MLKRLIGRGAALICFIGLLGFGCINSAFGFVKGIYVTQSSAQHQKTMNYLLENAKSLGISTFVIDTDKESKLFSKYVPMVVQSGIEYVARIVVFPTGGLPSEIKSQAYWEKRWKQMEYAISLGADQIQLDYIRYKPSQPPLESNYQDIYNVIQFFKKRLAEKYPNVKLQADVFGITAIKPGMEIGQDISKFGGLLDVVCPMVYPSHFEPHLKTSAAPYKTINVALRHLKKKTLNYPNLKVIPFIEAFNYRYPMSRQHKIKYIMAQMQAVIDNKANGFYVWSANNKYDTLFYILKNYNKLNTYKSYE